MQRVVATGEEIKNLMDDSLNIVCDEKKLVTQAEEIAHSLHNITALMSKISNVSAAHMACINQIDQAIRKWTI